MSVRFRIRTSQGQELSFATHEMFEEFVRSGDLSPDDLVYDGETGEWAPARTHPLILEIEYEQEEAAGAEAEASDSEPKEDGEAPASDLGLDLAPAQPAPVESEGEAAQAEEGQPTGAGDSPESDDEESFGLDLAPAAKAMTPEEEAAAFKAKMDSERSMDFDFAADAPALQGLKMDDSGVMAQMMAPVDAPPEPERPKPPKPKEPRPKAPPPRPAPKSGAGGKIGAAVVVLVLLGAGGYFGLGLLGSSDVDGATDPVDSLVVETPDVPEPPPPEPEIASTEEAVSGRAQERFLNATQALLRDLQPIPEVWVQGEYFTLPSDHPEVRQIWQGYLTVARSVRSADTERYRVAYEEALDAAAVVDERRAPRLAAALAAFERSDEARAAHWDRVEALATAAIQSHDALVGAEGLILFDASGTTGRPSGIGEGTSGRDSDSELLLSQVITLLQGALDADGMGPREGRNVHEWVWGGFLDTVTR